MQVCGHVCQPARRRQEEWEIGFRGIKQGHPDADLDLVRKKKETQKKPKRESDSVSPAKFKSPSKSKTGGGDKREELVSGDKKEFLRSGVLLGFEFQPHLHAQATLQMPDGTKLTSPKRRPKTAGSCFNLPGSSGNSGPVKSTEAEGGAQGSNASGSDKQKVPEKSKKQDRDTQKAGPTPETGSPVKKVVNTNLNPSHSQPRIAAKTTNSQDPSPSKKSMLSNLKKAASSGRIDGWVTIEQEEGVQITISRNKVKQLSDRAERAEQKKRDSEKNAVTSEIARLGRAVTPMQGVSRRLVAGNARGATPAGNSGRGNPNGGRNGVGAESDINNSAAGVTPVSTILCRREVPGSPSIHSPSRPGSAPATGRHGSQHSKHVDFDLRRRSNSKGKPGSGHDAKNVTKNNQDRSNNPNLPRSPPVKEGFVLSHTEEEFAVKKFKPREEEFAEQYEEAKFYRDEWYTDSKSRSIMEESDSEMEDEEDPEGENEETDAKGEFTSDVNKPGDADGKATSGGKKRVVIKEQLNDNDNRPQTTALSFSPGKKRLVPDPSIVAFPGQAECNTDIANVVQRVASEELLRRMPSPYREERGFSPRRKEHDLAKKERRAARGKQIKRSFSSTGVYDLRAGQESRIVGHDKYEKKTQKNSFEVKETIYVPRYEDPELAQIASSAAQDSKEKKRNSKTKSNTGDKMDKSNDVIADINNDNRDGDRVNTVNQYDDRTADADQTQNKKRKRLPERVIYGRYPQLAERLEYVDRECTGELRDERKADDTRRRGQVVEEVIDEEELLASQSVELLLKSRSPPIERPVPSAVGTRARTQVERKVRPDVSRRDVRNARSSLQEMIEKRREWKEKMRGRSKPLGESRSVGRIRKGESDTQLAIGNSSANGFADESTETGTADRGNSGTGLSGGAKNEYFCMSQRRAQTAFNTYGGRRSYQTRGERDSRTVRADRTWPDREKIRIVRRHMKTRHNG